MKKLGNYSGAGEGVTNRVPNKPFSTICHSEVRNRVQVTNGVGRTLNLTRFVTRVTNRVVVTNGVATGPVGFEGVLEWPGIVSVSDDDWQIVPRRRTMR